MCLVISSMGEVTKLTRDVRGGLRNCSTGFSKIGATDSSNDGSGVGGSSGERKCSLAAESSASGVGPSLWCAGIASTALAEGLDASTESGGLDAGADELEGDESE